MQLVLQLKVKQHKDPLNELEFPSLPSAQARLYSEETDRYLVWATNRLGWNQWDTLQEHVMMERTFAFDFFTRSRTPTELRRRVETLCRSMEKELAKPLKREREKRQRAEDAHEVALMKRLRTLVPKKRKKTRPPPSANPRCE
eukprot:COSAG01_NODE_3417_length_6121_cov_33.897376_2_plen_143_part_00